MNKPDHRWTRAVALCAVLGLAVLPLGLTAAHASTLHANKAKKVGGATVAQLFAPDYIFPYFPSADATNANEAFQSLFYRPLYFTPTNDGREAVNVEASAAKLPKVLNKGRTLLITLKSWKWSNGTSLTAQNVMFWLNMMRAEPAAYGLYIKGEIPDNIVSYRAIGMHQVEITFNQTYSTGFLELDQLGEVVPMPLAWDRTSAHHTSDCAKVVRDCGAVLKYLLSQARSPSTFASSPLWSIVDGPWKLKSISTNGSFVIVPNRRYSGSSKPRLSRVTFETFTSETTEYNVLRSGGSIDIGFIPVNDAPPKPPNKRVGRNPVSGYKLVPTVYWGAITIPMNMNNPKIGKILRQTYIRQAMQRTIDQPGYIRAYLSGYGFEQAGPVPSEPPNPYQAPIDRRGGPFPFNLKKAKSVLRSHGWKILPNRADKCVRPGRGRSDCGAGVPGGSTLSFSARYVNSPAWVGQTMQQWKSDASKIGIQVSLSSAPFSTVYGGAQECKPSQASCSWQIVNFDGIGNYTYPVGALYFSTTGALNYGSYMSAEANKLINDTIHNSNPAAMRRYDLFMAEQVPMLWDVMPVGALDEVKNNLEGVFSSKVADPVALSQPETWYYKKK